MAHHVEHMDVDPIDSDFDKENSYHHGNVLLQASSIEKGYEEMDVSDLNMKLRYPLTPNSSPMSKSLTANYTDNKNSDLQDDFSNISRSLNSSMTKSDKQKIPLQVIPPEQFVERNLSVLQPINSTITIEGSDITVKVSGASEAEEDISLPSSVSSTAAHTPEATTPTKESPKNGDSSIMRGLKSVFNMFRPSQSPIPSGDEGKFEQVPMDISQQNDDTDVTYNPMIASTPLATHKSESCSSKRNSPHKERLIFNNDLEKELKWNEENVFFNFKEKVPVFPLHTQLFENKAKNCTNVKNKENINTEEVFDETVDISNNTIIGEGTMNEDQTVSDSEFLDCETTFTKNDFQLHRDEENSNVNTQLHIQNSSKTSIPDISNETMRIKVENDKQKEIDSENDNVIKTSESNIDSTIINSVHQILHKENTSESFQQGYKTNFTSDIHHDTLEIDNRTENKQDEGHNSSYLQAFNDLNKVLTNEDFTKCTIGQEFKTSENEMLDIENEMTPAEVPLPDINDLSLSFGTNVDVTNRSLSEVISDVENFMNSQNDDKETSEVKSNVTFNNILLLSPETKDCATTVSEDNKSFNIEDKILTLSDNIDTSFPKCIEEEIANTNMVETQNVASGDMNISKMKEQYSLNENETYNEESEIKQKKETSAISNQIKESSLIKETSKVKSNLTFNNIILLSTETKDCATTVSEDIKSNNIEDRITNNIDTSFSKCIEKEITNTNLVETQNVDSGDMNISKIKEQYFLNENETYNEESEVKQKNETSAISNQIKESSLIKETSEVKSNLTYNNILLLSKESKDCATTTSEEIKSNNNEDHITDNIDTTSVLKCVEEEITNTNLVETQNVDSSDMNISKMKEQYSLNENETYNEEGEVKQKNEIYAISNQVKESSLIKETSEAKSNLTYSNILLLSKESRDCATMISEEIKSNNNENQITDNIDTSVLNCVEEITNTNIVETQNVDSGDINISKMKEQHSLNENETYSEEGGVKQKNETPTVSNQVANDTNNETELAVTPSVESKSKMPEEEENKETVSISFNRELNLESATKTLNEDKSFISEAQNKIVSQNSELTSPTSVEFICKEISTHNMVSNINDKPEDSLSKNVHIFNDTLLTSEQSSIQSNVIDNEIPKEKTEEIINKVESQPLFKIENDEAVPVAIINEVISCTNAEIVDAELPINNTQDFLNSPIDGVFVPDNVEENATVEILEKNEESRNTTMVKNDEQLRVEVIPNNNGVIDNGKVEVLNEQITASGSVTEVGIVADEKSQKITETHTNITLSPPPSPKIISTGQYNFDFDTIDDPFATKAKIRMSPPPNASFSKTNLLGEDSKIRRNVEEIKNDVNKNRRRSQPARKRAVGNTKKMNRTFDGVLSRSNVDININENNKNNVPQGITYCTDSTSNISKVNNDVKEMPYNKSVSQVSPEKNDAKVSEISSKNITENVNNMPNEHVMEVTENKIVIDKYTKTSPVPEEMEYLPSHEDTEINKYKKSEVSAPPKDLKPVSPSKGEIILESNTEINIEIEPRISTEVTIAPLNEKQTLKSNTECLKNVSSSKQSDYYSASTSTENIISKSVFNLPEIEDKNFNFSKKPKMCRSSSSEISAENLPATGSKIANPLAASDKVISMEPLDGKELKEVNVDSSNSGDENCTIREVHTEDEDTVEGPFLEAGDYDDSASESNKRDFIKINKVTTQKTDSDEMFIDAEAFEFLMNQNNENQVADSGKESLFLKFDPLFTRKITSEGVAAALNKIKNSTPKKTLFVNSQQKDLMFTPGCSNLKSNPDPFSVNNSLDCIEDPNGTIKPVMAVTPAVNPVVAPRNNVVTPPRNNRQSMTFTSPAMAVIDRLLSINSNNSMVDHNSSFPYSTEQSQAGLALTQLRELLAEKEINVQQLRTESRDLKDRLDTLESQTRSLEVESETRLRRINELNERLVEKTNMNKSMAKVVEEYEKTIASLIAETEEERRSRAEERVKLIKEKDEQTTHLASMEAAFSDLHSKYEKSKQVILNYKANEDKCKASLKEFEDSLVKMQNNYDSLKNHATTQLNHANQELEKLNRTHQAEVLKLNALIKRRDLHISSLEETLAQKTKANEELTAICDDLINKVG